MEHDDHHHTLTSALATHVSWQRGDAQWVQVARGEREPEAVAEIREQAGDSAEQIARDQALFRPLDEAELDALAELMPMPGEAAPGASEAPSETAPVLHFPGQRKRGFWILGALLAAAAALAVWWGIQQVSDPSVPRIAANEALPEYVLETDGGLRTKRGDTPSDERLHYRADTAFRWTLAPADEVEAPIELKVFAFAEHGPGRVLELAKLTTISEVGGVALRGQAAALGLPPGHWTVVLVVGRPSALPEGPVGARELEGREDLHVAALDLVIESSPD